MLANIIPGRRSQDRIGYDVYRPLTLMFAREQVASDDSVADVKYRYQSLS